MSKRNAGTDGNVNLRNTGLRNMDSRNIDLRDDLQRSSDGKEAERRDLASEDLGRELPAAQYGEDLGTGSGRPVEVGAASETEKLKVERDALLDRLARLQAEFDNARKRAVKEQSDFREYAAADVIKNFLPTLDSFERALKAGGLSGEVRNGIELIYRQFQDALQKAGVQTVSAAGQPFDPRFHEAIEMVDTTDVPDNHVVDELQSGYRYKDRLLRPAMVRVGRNSGK